MRRRSRSRRSRSHRSRSHRSLRLAGPALIVGAVLVGVPVACGDGDDASPSTSGPPAGGPAARGAELVSQRGCSACHSVDGSDSPGPTFEGLAGSEVELEDGTTVTADPAYLRRSIEDPGAQVAAGWAVAMPTNDLTPAQVDDVVAYLESLGR